jgi:hypothetical protein
LYFHDRSDPENFNLRATADKKLHMLLCMAVTARHEWTDQRLDDFTGDIDRRFDQVDHRFDRIETDLRELRAEVKDGFDAINGRIDSLQRTIIVSFTGMTTTIVAAVLGAAVIG